MLIRNFTPFIPFYFESEDRNRETFVTFLLKGTFDILPGRPLRPSPLQDGLTMGDEHYGEPIVSGVRYESDLAPTKVHSDVIVVADAHAPGGVDASRWDVGVSVLRGRVRLVSKRLAVTGERSWNYSLLRGWYVTDAQPCARVPLTYELAFGGSWIDDSGERQAYPENPVGRGFTRPKRRKADEPIPAPRVEAIDCPVRDIGTRYRPEGVGAVCKAWKPRLDYAGTYDDRWLAADWPHLPQDFDFRFYNAAPPDLQVEDFLRGDEEVELTGMHPAGPILFRLPGYRVGVLFEDRGGEAAGNDLDLDTLTIDLHRMKAFLVWRIASPKRDAIRKIEPHMELRREVHHGG